MRMKYVRNLFVVFSLSLAIFSCDKDDDNPSVGGTKDSTTVTGEITSNTTWTANKIYTLKNFVYVTNGATLTIEPGTIIKGDEATKATLIIEKGAKIQAIGTPDKPIVFTSAQPAGKRADGDWGGLVLIGKAPHNRPGSQTFEGGIRGTYGTDNAVNDNSGTLKYVRIEFAGIALTSTTNTEINGLTLYNVGAGTTIDYVQVSHCGDDAFEWFGGDVNAKHLVAYRTLDDDFDTDHGFVGKVQYGLSLRDSLIADQSGSNGFESDNFNPGVNSSGPLTANNGLPLTEGVFANMSVFAFKGTPSAKPTSAPGSGPYQSGMHLRRNTAISILNSVIVGYPEGLRLDGTATLANATSNKLDLRGVVIANMTTSFKGFNDVPDTDAQTFFNATERGNQIITLANLGTLGLNANTFKYGTPSFALQTTSPLLTGAKWDGKGNNAFFDKVTYRGAFDSNAANWLDKWTNWDPQNTEYK